MKYVTKKVSDLFEFLPNEIIVKCGSIQFGDHPFLYLGDKIKPDSPHYDFLIRYKNSTWDDVQYLGDTLKSC